MASSAVVVDDAVDVLDCSFNKHDDDFDLFASARSLGIEEEPEKVEDTEVAVESSSPTEENKRFVSPKDFELLKVIGMGSFGKVLQVRNRQSKKVLAMKVISKRLLKRKVSYVENVQAERDILTKVRHPFVVTMHCSFQTKEKLFIIMDFLAGGELFLRMGREGIFREHTAAFYLGEIVLALEHLHSHGILHRDLKPENILLGSDGHTCLTDFGLAKDLGSDFDNDDDTRALTVCGTQEYMAPEMVARKGYGRAADFWSLGCIAYEMLSGKPPFLSRKGSKDLFRKIMQERVRMPDGSSAAACVLLKGLLNRNATARLGAARSTMFEVGGVAGLKNCAFFAGMDWEKLEKKEIDPPVTLDVDNDEDLRHFHNEFTEMPLPRSVTEMNKEHFEPRRVASDAFRGFSFIQEDFDLPERKNTELDNYWNSIDEDGESVSECASSKFGFGEEKQQVVPTTEKKKRPPRKRKKKKAAAASPMPSENGDKIPTSENGAADNTTANGIAISMDKVKEPKSDVAAVKEESKAQENARLPRTNSPEKATPEQTPRLPGVGATTKGVSPSVPQPKSKKEESWEQVGKPKKSTKPSSSPQPRIPSQVAGKVPVRSRVPPARSLPQGAGPRTPYKPAPGSWASKTQSPSTPWAQQASRGIVENSKREPSSPRGSTDWRAHTMVVSPRKQKALVTPPPAELQSWPSLGDFPPPVGGAPPASPATKSSPRESSWGTKQKSPPRGTPGASAWKR